MGDTVCIPVTFVTDDSTEDITGYTISFVFSGSRAKELLLQVDVTVHDDAETGRTSLTLDPVDLIDLGGIGSYWLTIIEVNEDDEEVTRAMLLFKIESRIQREISST